jgi:hypothetical protein
MRSILAPTVSPKLENRLGFRFENSLHDQLAAGTLANAERRGVRFSPSGLAALDFRRIAKPSYGQRTCASVDQWYRCELSASNGHSTFASIPDTLEKGFN